MRQNLSAVFERCDNPKRDARGVGEFACFAALIAECGTAAALLRSEPKIQEHFIRSLARQSPIVGQSLDRPRGSRPRPVPMILPKNRVPKPATGGAQPVRNFARTRKIDSWQFIDFDIRKLNQTQHRPPFVPRLPRIRGAVVVSMT